MFIAATGFLGTRASLMLDVVFLAMFLVVPALGFGVYLAKQKKYQAHKLVQLTLGTVLLITVLAFEVDMRFFTEWEELAKPSRFWSESFSNPVRISLWIHLAFAVPTLFLWIFVIVQALRKFPSPPIPGPHSASHLFWARFAGLGMFMTAVTGWVFYYLGFVA